MRRPRTRPVPPPSTLERVGRSFRSAASDRSAWSIASRMSFASIGSLACAASLGSLGSVGSILSIGSTGSLLSIGSAGSILSIGSAGSILSVGAAGGRPGRAATSPDANGGAVVRPHRLTVERGATALAVAALLAALR